MLSQVFSPAAPIDKKRLFTGRTDQLRRTVDAINQRGQHAIIYGERGVGKTSMANVINEFLQVQNTQVLAPKASCDGNDTYDSVWRKVFSEIQLVTETQQLGFTGEVSKNISTFADSLPNEITPDIVRRALTKIGSQCLLIIVIDEFDRLPGKNITQLFADTIKALSDYAVPVTIVLVGVADSVDDLIAGHQSAERALVQILMPRMSRDELTEILQNAFSNVGMRISLQALERIVLLSQGLPHYTHLLGLNSGRTAVDAGSREITIAHTDEAISAAIHDAQQIIKRAYHRATTSPRKENIYRQVLLACSLAKTDELGYFAAADVRGPMKEIMGKRYDIPAFSRHLNDFCGDRRGYVLQKTGTSHRYRFRFVNPLMQPFVIMQGIESAMINGGVLERANH